MTIPAMQRASIGVLIPVFKDQKGLTRTLEALARDPDSFDVLVVDDGSPEPMRCPERCGSHPVTLLRLDPNRGIEHALNAGVERLLAEGYRYIARLDADDIAMPGRFSRQAEFLERNPDVGMVGSWARCVDDDGNFLFTMRFPTEHEAILRKQRYVPGLLHPTIMMRADALREVGPYVDRYKAAEDYDLFVRFGRRYRLANIPEALTEYVISARGTTTAKRRQTLVSRLRIQLDNFGWTDPHSYLGVVRTLVFMGLPFGLLNAVKRVVWK